ncbi:MAG: peptidoglycan DD-metalloendopeptidase family protein [Alphaproteobacteria bacterium]|nr:peptidoglycan DD-metalloendopeptidase family protein [Alphaproteobacteria bacterium]
MRKLLPVILTFLALAGCATATRAPVVYGASSATAAPDAATVARYDAAPRATVFGDLFLCSGSTVSNSGPVGDRGESLVYTPYIIAPSGVLLRAPVEGGCLSSGYGVRGAATGGGRWHTGIDIANPGGGFVFAAGDGRVAATGWRGDYGLTLELDHGAGVHTLYAHLSQIDPRLRPGVSVASGTAIARMGATGNATGVHLHYEVIVDGEKVNPLSFGARQQETPETAALTR